MNDVASPTALKTVLIVDDDADSRRTIAAVLTEGGFDVAEAASAAAAIERLQRDHATIGMVLTDVTMPGGMSGVELAYHVRGNYPGLPVAIISGDISDLERSIVDRTDVPFIKKPFLAEALYTAVREAMKQA